MALDACFLQFIAQSLKDLEGLQVEKVYEPSKDEVLLHMRGKKKLMLSCSPTAARIHLTERQVENPKTPPAFCMVLRKHLTGAKLLRVYTPTFERVIFLEFEGKNDFFEPEKKILLLEIMGRTSNIILLNDENKIINAIKHVDFTMTRGREILPGLRYELPAPQDKIPFLSADAADFETLFIRPQAHIGQAVLDTYAGISPVVAREICQRALGSFEARVSELSTPQKHRLMESVLTVCETVKRFDFAGCCVFRKEDGGRVDLSFMPLSQYEGGADFQYFDDPNKLLEEYYTKAAEAWRLKQKAQDLSQFLTRTAARITRTMAVRQKELFDSEKADKYRIYGELIQANLYQLQRGARKLVAQNYYEPELPETVIPLRPELSPVQNAQLYFKKYAKARNGQKIIGALIEKDKAELHYLDSVFVALCDAESEEDIEQIRAELVAGGYLKPRAFKGTKKTDLSHPRTFITDDGYTVYVGKSNLQNDFLTVRLSRKNDIWMHTKGVHGSHTLLVTGGKTLDELPDTAILQAAALCAFYSKGKESSKVEVDYCPVQNVKKPSGAKPGMVVYDNYYTLLVSPDGALAERIRKK